MVSSNSGLRQSTDKETNFEELLLEISALFINLPVNSIDEVIEDTQRRICHCLDFDLSSLWQWSNQDSHTMTITHLYSPPDGPEQPEDIDASQVVPWIYKQMLSGRTLAISNEDLPEEARLDKETRLSFGVRSSVIVPLIAGDEPILGVISFDILHEARSFDDREVKRLRLVTEIFTNALLRQRSEKQLLESEAKLSLAAESAGAGLWELDCTTGAFWATDKAREIFGYDSDEVVNMERFERSVYPADLTAVKRALASSMEKRDKLLVEYRINNDKNRPTWICSRGRPYCNSEGTITRMFGISIDITDRKKLEEQLRGNLAEIERLKEQLEQENYILREDLKAEQGFEHIIGQSKKFRAVLNAARQVASTPATVLLLGETGTGKGIVAHAIQAMSDRRSQPFVTVNCAALPHDLIESELFGREKGAFTGAHASQAGRFEIANHGTIFLDEIGEMSLDMQVKLLAVLQDGKIERLGSPKSVKVNVRVIAATARDLKKDIKNGRFREDLYYRLKVFPITIPPLRQRTDDIVPLTQHFIEKYSRKMGKEIKSIPKRSLVKLQNYSWPGNVRELEHLIERSVIISPGNSLIIGGQLQHEGADTENRAIKDLLSLEHDHIKKVLSMTDWKIEGPGGAASILNINPSTLRSKLKKLQIRRPS